MRKIQYFLRITPQDLPDVTLLTMYSNLTTFFMVSFVDHTMFLWCVILDCHILLREISIYYQIL